jgi:hypothetical protein
MNDISVEEVEITNGIAVKHMVEDYKITKGDSKGLTTS